MAVSRPLFCCCIVVGIVAVSFAALFIRFAQAASMPVLVIAAWRLIVACLILLPYAALTRRREILSVSKREASLLWGAGVCLGLHFVTWLGSLDYTSVARSVVLVSMGPIFVGLGSRLFLKERLRRTAVLGMGAAALGSVVISWADSGQSESHLLGDMLALAGAVFAAGYLMIGRKVRATRSLGAYVAMVYTVAMFTVLIAAGLAGQSLWGYSWAAYRWVVLLGLVSQLIGHSVLNWALRHVTATLVSVITLAEPLGSTALAYFILKESVGWSVALGACLVLTGIYVVSRAELAAEERKRLTDTGNSRS